MPSLAVVACGAGSGDRGVGSGLGGAVAEVARFFGEPFVVGFCACPSFDAVAQPAANGVCGRVVVSLSRAVTSATLLSGGLRDNAMLEGRGLRSMEGVLPVAVRARVGSKGYVKPDGHRRSRSRRGPSGKLSVAARPQTS